MEGNSAVGAFTDAILAALRADPALGALVGTKIYDQVPGAPKATLVVPPWVFLGPAGTKRCENGSFRGWEIRQRIFCITDDFDRRSAWKLADAVDRALDLTVPDLADGCGFHLADDLKMIDSGDMIDPTKPKSVFVDVIGIVYRDNPSIAIDGGFTQRSERE